MGPGEWDKNHTWQSALTLVFGDFCPKSDKYATYGFQGLVIEWVNQDLNINCVCFPGISDGARLVLGNDTFESERSKRWHTLKGFRVESIQIVAPFDQHLDIIHCVCVALCQRQSPSNTSWCCYGNLLSFLWFFTISSQFFVVFISIVRWHLFIEDCWWKRVCLQDIFCNFCTFWRN